MVNLNVSIRYLADQPEFVPLLSRWLAEQWPDWYDSDGPGNVLADLEANADRTSLPLGIVAVENDELCDYVSLKDEAVQGYEEFGPWAGAALVRPNLRNQGIRSRLIERLEKEAKALGYGAVYSGNRNPGGILTHRGWSIVGQVVHNGEELYVYRKAL
jgi:GNAT superfamily N-acetyltransferase